MVCRVLLTYDCLVVLSSQQQNGVYRDKSEFLLNGVLRQAIIDYDLWLIACVINVIRLTNIEAFIMFVRLFLGPTVISARKLGPLIMYTWQMLTVYTSDMAAWWCVSLVFRDLCMCTDNLSKLAFLIWTLLWYVLWSVDEI